MNIKNGELHILPFRHQFLSQLEGNDQTKYMLKIKTSLKILKLNLNEMTNRI